MYCDKNIAKHTVVIVIKIIIIIIIVSVIIKCNMYVNILE